MGRGWGESRCGGYRAQTGEKDRRTCKWAHKACVSGCIRQAQKVYKSGVKWVCKTGVKAGKRVAGGAGQGRPRSRGPAGLKGV